MTLYSHISGCLLGTAVGDAIGLPREGLSRRRAERLFGGRPLSHALVAGRGLCSDDTEHTVMVGLALLASGAEPDRFAGEFAKRLRWWLMRMPAGVGFGTLRACLKLWCGVSPKKSGVRSAGNGPAMRSALLGVVAKSAEELAELVERSTRVTHSDPRAEQGAQVVAAITYAMVSHGGDAFTAREVLELTDPLVSDGELRRNLSRAIEAGEQGLDPNTLADRLGLGNSVSGYVVHTVPVAVYCWFVNQGNFRDTVEAAVCLGGDSDTVGAIAGALAGAQLGSGSIPEAWVAGLAEWPCTVAWMDTLARTLSELAQDGRSGSRPGLSPLLLMTRNFVFLVVVLVHGFRRLLPPY